jgi:hypothetical protein
VFDAPFGLNIKSKGYNNVTSHFWYDWSYNFSSKITYPDKCLPFVSEDPCDLTFNDVGTHLFTKINKSKPFADGNKKCCLLFPGIGSLPPNFLAPFNFSMVEDAANMFGDMIKCNKWHNFGFAYWTEIAGFGADIQVRDGMGDTFWNYGKLSGRRQNTTMYDVPKDCTGKCAASDFDGGIDALRAFHPEMLGPFFRRV